jgi:hypothetical protein
MRIEEIQARTIHTRSPIIHDATRRRAPYTEVNSDQSYLFYF